MRALGSRLGALAIMAIIATALVGAAYTAWYESLALGASISTGTVSVTWGDSTACGATGSLPAPATASSADPQTLAVQLSGLHAGDTIDCTIQIHNPGTVPVVIAGIGLNIAGPEGPAQAIACSATRCGGEAGALTLDVNEALGCTLLPGRTHTARLQLVLAAPQPEAARYSTTATIALQPWNIGPWQDCGTLRSS